MTYDIQMNLPAGWQKEMDTYTDESGAEVTHLEATLPDPSGRRDSAMIDIYVGEMPSDTTAEDQAFSNYADIVGFEEDDPEDFNPIRKIKFNSRNAYAFDALCEDDSPMTFLSQEVRSEILAVICAAAVDEVKLKDVLELIEHNFRVK
ncbi:MAG: hypothetical protein MJY43_04500 [Bacteroidales bacterium]|nr:hypothetical protein [Bacteroidales bacterium]